MRINVPESVENLGVSGAEVICRRAENGKFVVLGIDFVGGKLTSSKTIFSDKCTSQQAFVAGVNTAFALLGAIVLAEKEGGKTSTYNVADTFTITKK